MMRNPLTLFMWGYWGWGNSTRELIEAVDTVELSRGFAPAVFVDVRIRRAVRAQGFNGDAFEKSVGKSRYRWMRNLGNAAVLDGTGGVYIRDPTAANKLLDWANDLAGKNRRILFFCACENPYDEYGNPACHRVEVGNLVLKYARQRSVPVQIVEWPGSEPQIIDLNVDPEVMHKLMHGSKNLALGMRVPLAKYAGLGWGSVARVQSGDHEIVFRTGPARWKNGESCLPVLSDLTEPQHSAANLFASAKQWCRKHGYAAQQVCFR